MGALPDSQVQTFVKQLASGGDGGHAHGGPGHGGPDHAAEVLAIADEALKAGDIGTAAQAYGHVLQDFPGQPKAVAGLAACYLKSGDVERARSTLQLVRPDGANDEAIRAVEAELKLRDNAAPRGEMELLRAKLAADPADHQARFDLALALDGEGKREDALAEFLELVRRDRKWNEEAARKQLLTMFEAMGPTDPRTIEARRKLSGLLFS
jgi:putative thioredoxin